VYRSAALRAIVAGLIITNSAVTIVRDIVLRILVLALFLVFFAVARIAKSHRAVYARVRLGTSVHALVAAEVG
jgi:hypothetical protein